MTILHVALPVPLFRVFDYLLPEDLPVCVGARVRVPFGQKKAIGVVVGVSDTSEIEPTKLKAIEAVLDTESLYSPPLWQLLKWLASYYHSPIGEVLFQALPVLLRQGKSAPKIEKILHFLTVLGDTPLINANNVHFLNQEQALAMSLLSHQSGFQPWLLQGVTGSGKTEIYLQFIADILKTGKQVLVLVPEIGLTPQTVKRFQARFNVLVDALHSNVNNTERAKIWARVRNGQTAILIGTRSALFTPFADLGAIIIDEEHDRSFKQQDQCRYHARDLAVMYAKMLNIPIILGSATPSLESLNNAKMGKYRLLSLQKRAGNSQAAKHFVIDMKKQTLKNGLSLALIHQIQQHLNQGNQVLLFLNRRGFSPLLLCHDCGYVHQCSYCDKPLTYHQHQRVLKCHHCGLQQIIPMQCQACGSTYLIPTGMGTEQLEEQLKQLFPETPITRIDRDSTARKGALEKRLKQVQLGQAQLLIGTQMLAKGHHFPNVTLVALLDVDGALFSTDFRAEEQFAQLYVQVAGRAGRGGKQGEVVLQTHFVDHPLLQSLLTQGYDHFAQHALHLRQMAGLPPFSFQVLFKASSKKSEEAEKLLNQIGDYFRSQNTKDLQIVGALPCAMAKKAGKYRWQLWLQHTSRGVLQQALKHFPREKFTSTKVKWTIDVDPIDFS